MKTIKLDNEKQISVDTLGEDRVWFNLLGNNFHCYTSMSAEQAKELLQAFTEALQSIEETT